MKKKYVYTMKFTLDVIQLQTIQNKQNHRLPPLSTLNLFAVFYKIVIQITIRIKDMGS